MNAKKLSLLFEKIEICVWKWDTLFILAAKKGSPLFRTLLSLIYFYFAMKIECCHCLAAIEQSCYITHALFVEFVLFLNSRHLANLKWAWVENSGRCRSGHLWNVKIWAVISLCCVVSWSGQIRLFWGLWSWSLGCYSRTQPCQCLTGCCEYCDLYLRTFGCPCWSGFGARWASFGCL